MLHKDVNIIINCKKNEFKKTSITRVEVEKNLTVD